jgi:NADH-ubiquinone oxidoreductase chain 5
MGNLVINLPYTFICFCIGSFSIIGFPFLTGFYSKDLILEVTFNVYIIDAWFIYFLALFAAFCTSLYSIKILLFVFFLKNNRFKSNFFVVENKFFIYFSTLILCFLSMFIGYFFNYIIIDLGNFFFGNFLFILPEHFSCVDAEFASF